MELIWAQKNSGATNAPQEDWYMFHLCDWSPGIRRSGHCDTMTGSISFQESIMSILATVYSIAYTLHRIFNFDKLHLGMKKYIPSAKKLREVIYLE